MAWIKDIITDLIVTVAIVAAVLVEEPVFSNIVIGYSVLMLIAKLVVFFGEQHLQMMQKVQTRAPEWISHLLYGINVVVLFIFTWWYTGALWVVIWIVSYFTKRRLKDK